MQSLCFASQDHSSYNCLNCQGQASRVAVAVLLATIVLTTGFVFCATKTSGIAKKLTIGAAFSSLSGGVICSIILNNLSYKRGLGSPEGKKGSDGLLFEGSIAVSTTKNGAVIQGASAEAKSQEEVDIERIQKDGPILILDVGEHCRIYKTIYNGEIAVIKKSTVDYTKKMFEHSLSIGAMGVSCLAKHYSCNEGSNELLMEYIDGQRLADFWRNDLSVGEKRAVLKSFLNGIKEIIGARLFPGDLNTMNVMVDKQLRVRFVDLEGYVSIEETGTRGNPNYGGAFSEIGNISYIVSKLNGDSDWRLTPLGLFYAKNKKLHLLTTELIREFLQIIDSELERLDSDSVSITDAELLN